MNEYNTLRHRLKHPCFPQPENDETKVWRYLDLPKFLNLLMTKKLFFSRIDVLNDLYEGSLTRKNFLYDEAIREMQALNGSERLGPSNFKMRESFYVNCWRIDDQESEAMWKLYCPLNDGVAIQTSYKKLVSSLTDEDNVHIGKVRYLDYENDEFPRGNVFYPIMHKRKAFEHEKEIRLVKVDTSLWDKIEFDNTEYGVTIDWNPISCLQKVCVNPYSSPWYFKTVKELMEKLDLNIEIEWSKLKSDPLY